MSEATPNDTPPERSQSDSELDEFIRNLTESQTRLKAYLMASLANYDDAVEVLQRTNLVLWKNARSFRPGAEFMPWAVTLAKYEVMSYYRERTRDRHVFSEELATLMLATAANEIPEVDDRFLALRECINQLPNASKQIIRLRYENRAAIKQIAEQLDRTVDSIKSALARTRRSLANCITSRIKQAHD